MRTRQALRLLPFLVLCITGGAAAAEEKAYEIKLARPIKVGTKYALTADGALLRQVTISRGGVTQKQPEDGYGIHLEATVEVLALDDVDEEAKISCVIDKCTRSSPEGETELLARGKVLVAEGKGKDTHFSLEDGGELSKDATDALELVFTLDTNDTLTDDDLLGTKDKKKPGESWPVTPEAVAKDSERVGVIVKPQDVEGEFRLEGTEKVGDIECLKLSGNLKVKKLLTKADENEDDGLPEGFVVEGGSMEAKYAGLFPVDSSVGSLAESASMTFLTHIKGGTGKDDAVTVESRVQRAVEMKRRFLQP
jgi:hypothetical protein